MGRIDSRLAELGIELPQAPPPRAALIRMAVGVAMMPYKVAIEVEAQFLLR